MDKDILLNIELPQGWAKATIAEMISANGVFVDGDWIESKDQDPNGEVRLIQLADIGDGSFRDKSSRFLTLKRANEIGCTFLVEGDILVARMPDPIGRACLFPLKGESKFVTAVDVAIIRTGEDSINNKLLNYFINSPLIRNKIEALQSGTTRKRISRGNLSLIEFPVPPINEQNRIVLKLDELLSELEKGKEQLQVSSEQLKVYKQSILKHAFEGKLTEEWRSKQKKLKTPDDLVNEIRAYRKERYEKQLTEYKTGIRKEKPKEQRGIITLSNGDIRGLPLLPEGWTWVKVSSLGEIETGTTPSKVKPEYYGDKYPFYKPTELNEGFNVRNAKEYLTESGIRQARLLPVNSILVTSIGATIGKTGIIRVAGASNQQINAIIPHEIFNPNFIYFQSIGQFFQDQIISNAVATTLPILNKSKFESLVFAICSIEEQELIVIDMELKFSNSDKMEETINQNILHSENLRQGLLQKAFQGKLVEQDPNDGPASALLERIKKEREEYLNAEKERKKTEKPLHIKARKMAEELKRIIEIIKESEEPVSAKKLWESSIYKNDIDAFYSELKKLIENGEIEEEEPRIGKESRLKIVEPK
ncbi:MAG: restriction endonuclease subunit S [Bacteroidia bacterium]